MKPVKPPHEPSVLDFGVGGGTLAKTSMLFDLTFMVVVVADFDIVLVGGPLADDDGAFPIACGFQKTASGSTAFLICTS